MSMSPSHAGTSIYYNGQDQIEWKVKVTTLFKVEGHVAKKIALRIDLQYKKKLEKACFLLQLQKRTPKWHRYCFVKKKFKSMIKHQDN